ncbi:hypothetical protein V1279_003471 [Bradyrhizobium sp. AZCC 1610]|uniref:hypothetical protein n=1 Tax=Bradyrhizobium sp. AZCC 1610 TaxID=3117020 RepID=UPI0030611696
MAAEKQGADKATVAVTIESHQRDSRANPADKTIRYVKGAVDGSPWSVRAPARRFIQVLGFASIRICK